MLSFVAVLVTMSVVAGQQDVPRNPSLLPFVGTDLVTVVDAESGRTEELSGVIEDLIGDRVMLRRAGGGRLDTIRLRDVRSLQFAKLPLYDDALRLMNAGEWAAALDAVSRSITLEPRPWVQREMDATAARALLALRQFDAVITRIEQILERDPSSRHLHLLPLVWDERLPESERLVGRVEELRSDSIPRRLCAASALLHDAEHGNAAAQVLAELRVSGIAGIQELAETQLWRLQVLQNVSLRAGEYALRRNRVDDLDPWFRGGPLAVLARISLAEFAYDQAAAAFLWIPLMSFEDRPLAAACLMRAAEAVRLAGRPQEAERLIREATLRFPDCSAVLQRPAEPPQDSPENRP